MSSWVLGLKFSFGCVFEYFISLKGIIHVQVCISIIIFCCLDVLSKIPVDPRQSRFQNTKFAQSVHQLSGRTVSCSHTVHRSTQWLPTVHTGQCAVELGRTKPARISSATVRSSCASPLAAELQQSGWCGATGATWTMLPYISGHIQEMFMSKYMGLLSYMEFLSIFNSSADYFCSKLH